MHKRTLIFKSRWIRLGGLLALAGGVLALLTSPVWAQKSSPQKAQNFIHVTADRLVSEAEADFAEFIGNVRVTQDTTVITADRLRIEYSRSDKSNGPGLGLTDEKIKKLTAVGNVRIRFDDKVADTQHAEYLVSERLLTLTGAGTTVTSGENSVTGSKITFYRQTGRVAVEGEGQEQIKAVFHAPENGIK